MADKFAVTDSTGALTSSESMVYQDAAAAISRDDLTILKVFATILKDTGIQCVIKTQAAISGGVAAATAAERATYHIIQLLKAKERPLFGSLWPAFALITRYLDQADVVPEALMPSAQLKKKLQACFLLRMPELAVEKNSTD